MARPQQRCVLAVALIAAYLSLTEPASHAFSRNGRDKLDNSPKVTFGGKLIGILVPKLARFQVASFQSNCEMAHRLRCAETLAESKNLPVDEAYGELWNAGLEEEEEEEEEQGGRVGGAAEGHTGKTLSQAIASKLAMMQVASFHSKVEMAHRVRLAETLAESDGLTTDEAYIKLWNAGQP